MSGIRPMLAVEGAPEVNKAAAGQSSMIQFPCIAQAKFDGFRCIIVNGIPMTRTLKPIPNLHVRSKLETVFGCSSIDLPVHPKDHPLNGMDGELIALDPEDLSELDLHKTQSRLNTYEGHPRFVFHVFDDFTDPKLPYVKRQTNLNARLERIRNHVSDARLETNPERRSPRIHDHVFQAVQSRICERIEDILEFEAEVLAWGGEGIMLKSMTAAYKFGRSTLREFASIKVKRFEDAEAEVVGFIEKMHNDNEATLDERGYTKRASNKENLRPAGTLGALVCYDKVNDIEFELGTGFDDATRLEIWENQDRYMGATVNYKFKGRGPNGKPLIPSFQGIRYDV